MDASPEPLQRVIGFGAFDVDVAAHQLRKQGRPIRLQEQPFRVLEILLAHPGELITREQLQEALWPGSVYVDFDHGLNNAIARLRDVLGDNPAVPRFIETVPRRGYRFIHPLGSSSTHPHGVGRSEANVDARPPSIAVLPFVNRSSDEEDEHFADGLTAELTNKLAGIRGLEVVARTSSLSFKGKQVSAQEIAQALQVNHLLEGSVHRAGARLRITAQLIDARTDEHVWAQVFDRGARDIFQIQEDIAFAVAAALKVSLLAADEIRIRGRGTNDPEACRLYLIARAHVQGRAMSPDMGLAKRALDAAIDRDPNCAPAYAELARYYLRHVTRTLTDPEECERLGVAAAERAVLLDPGSSEAVLARANFGFWRYRARGDYAAYVEAQSDMQRAIELDPTNSLAFDDFGRAILWQEPDRAASLFERSMELDLACTGPNVSIATLLGNRGQLEAARKRCADLLERAPDATACGMAIGTLETYYGNFDRAVEALRASEKFFAGPARIQLWSIHMSMNDRAGAFQWLDFGKSPMEKILSAAARLAMDGSYGEAFKALDRGRTQFSLGNLLDLPAAKLALIAGESQQTLEILQRRLPDLASGIEPINARNLLPALDLATAQVKIGANDRALTFVERIAAYLDSPGALRLPMFAFQRARAHALAGEHDAALCALDRAFAAGLRTTWALDLRPQSMLYIDPIEADPAFSALRDDPRLTAWFRRIRDDNARQFDQLRDCFA